MFIFGESMPNIPLCLCVLKHRAPLARGSIFLPQKNVYDRFLLMWCNLKILTIPKFPENVCLTACGGLVDLPPSGPMQGAS